MSNTKNEWQRQHRKKTNNIYTKRYEKTPNGFLMRMYRNMQSRVTGVQHSKSHLYYGKTLLCRQEFYDWAKNSDRFWELYNDWVFTGYNRKYTPTVDRIDSSIGYELTNMRWMTHSVFSRLGTLSKNKKLIENHTII
jgi:hypothetical protein